MYIYICLYKLSDRSNNERGKYSKAVYWNKSTPTRELYICVYIYFLILCRRVTTVTLDAYQVLDAILIFSQYERVEEKSKRKEERNGASSFSKLSPCVYTYM